MVALVAAHDEHMAIACSDDPQIACSDGDVYRTSEAKPRVLRIAVYGVALDKYVKEWSDDCNEVPSVAEVKSRWIPHFTRDAEGRQFLICDGWDRPSL